MRYLIESMTIHDIPRVIEIEKLAYPTSQWPQSAYRRELQENQWAYYFVLRDLTYEKQITSDKNGLDNKSHKLFSFLSPKNAAGNPKSDSIVGYAGLWLPVDESHITTIAAHPDWQGKGLGELMLIHLIDTSLKIGGFRLTLEVRVSNFVAQNLYRKYGFVAVSTRPHYYSDNNEDAYIMWTADIRTDQYREMFEGHGAKLINKLFQEG